MNYRSRLLHAGALGTACIFGSTATLTAQDSTVKIPLKQLAPAEARSSRSLNAVSSLRALSDGRVYVNDNQRRQVLLFDAALKDVKVIVDPSAGAVLPYGQRPNGMLPYLGDSTIIVDPSTSAMVILSPQGKVARIMASPRTNDINMLSNVNLGSNAFDSKGQLVYRQGNAGGGPGLAQMFGSGNDRGGRGGQPGGQGGQPGRGGAPGAPDGRGGDAGGRGGEGRGGEGARGGGGLGGGPGGGGPG